MLLDYRRHTKKPSQNRLGEGDSPRFFSADRAKRGTVPGGFVRASKVCGWAIIVVALAASLAPRPAVSATSSEAVKAEASSAAIPDSASPPAAPITESTRPANCHVIRAHDQVWLISTRGLGCPDGSSAPGLRFWQSNGSGGWTDSSLAAFLAADDPAIPTEFYVHGNFEDFDETAQRGLALYGRLVAQAPDSRPFRFVIWSWPTDRGKHPLQLTREHAHRADGEAYYLGWLIDRMDRRVQVGLIGYSLGSRVVTGAVHLLGGGQLIGLSLNLDAKAVRPTVRVALVAAAEDCDWLSPGRPNGEAIGLVEKMLLLNNGCDSVLKKYPHMERCSRAEALGYVGVCGHLDMQKIVQIDVCCAVGTVHEWSRFFYNDSLIADMLPYLFLDAAK
jgi:hypothetical protein